MSNAEYYFDLRSYPTTGSILFFLGEGECQYILETETGELEGKMKMTIQWESGICSSIITLIFGFFMTLGQYSGSRHVSGETGTTLQKGCFYVVVYQ